MPTVRYSPKLKAEALARLLAAGYPHTPGALTRVARQLKIPRSTLTFWAQNPSLPVRPRRHYRQSSLATMTTTIAASIESTLPSSHATESASIASPTTTIDAHTATTAIDTASLPQQAHQEAVEPPTIADITTFYRHEIVRIKAELHAARAAASYKDLIAALRGLTTDLQTLDQLSQSPPVDLNAARLAFRDLLRGAAPLPDSSDL